MAIYQYFLAFVPKKGLLAKHKLIPNKIEINTESEYFEAKTDTYWELSEIAFDEIKIEIDKIVNIANWGNEKDSFNWKTYSTELDNDAFMSINLESKNIKELSFRADLREPTLKFLNGMLELAERNKMMMMDRKGNLLNPEINEIEKNIKLSNSFKFIENPEKFFNDLNDGIISIE